MARYMSSEHEQSHFSAKSIEADTLLHMGLVYATGVEVEQDLVAAHKWFNLAAMKGSHQARQYRLEIAEELTRTQLREAQRLAREWISRR